MNLQIFLTKMCLLSLVLIFHINRTQCQQRITLNDNSNQPLGQFFSRLYHKTEQGLVQLDEPILYLEQNSILIIKIYNLLWYEENNETNIRFDTDQLSYNVQNRLRYIGNTKHHVLNSNSENSVELEFEIAEPGDYQIVIPFKTDFANARFLEYINVLPIHEEKPKEEGINPKLIRKEWNDVDLTSIEMLSAFVNKYKAEPNANKYINAAKREIEKLEHDKMIKDDDSHSFDDVEKDLDKVTKNVQIKENKDYQANIDSTNENSLTFIMPKGDTLKYIFSTSSLPLQFRFLKTGQVEADLNNIIGGVEFEGNYLIHIDQEYLDDNQLFDMYQSFEVYDASNVLLYKIPIKGLKRSKGKTLLYVGMLFSLLIGAGAYLLMFQKNEKKKKAVLKQAVINRVKENQQKLSMDNVEESSGKSNPKKKTKLVITKAKVDKDLDLSLEARRSEKIKILNRKVVGKSLTEDDFRSISNHSNVKRLDLREIWKDTSLSYVFMNDIFIEELNHFLKESSTKDIKNELQGAIPEVGGFLMGRFYKSEEGIWMIMEKFVPFVPEYNDVFKIEIGTKTLVDELGDAQDKFPELEVVGWFHTHPGHGLFLSRSDLSVQRHFPKKFQVAMEIDSLTPDLDMALFSRKKSGMVNNTEDRKDGKLWFRWTEIGNVKKPIS